MESPLSIHAAPPLTENYESKGTSGKIIVGSDFDFIVNYDIKYRLGRDTENEEE
jgi:hypothetical protein